MGPFDLRPVFTLAVIGLVASLVGGTALIGWLGYHLWRALSLYLGAPS